LPDYRFKNLSRPGPEALDLEENAAPSQAVAVAHGTFDSDLVDQFPRQGGEVARSAGLRRKTILLM
jgi:hypothetical protein